MNEIYLHIDGQQNGPYTSDQVRQFLTEGRITAETPAWHQGLTTWTTAGQMVAFVPVGGGVPVAPARRRRRSSREDKGMSGWLIALIIVGCGVFGCGFIGVLAGIALGPITKGIEKAKESASMQYARSISIAMFSYANDHNGAYPDGKTSTEVFQKLIDQKYITDPGVFYILGMPGKTKATSLQLTADNVCYDVTSGVTSNSPDGLPVVFSTGYTVTYAAGAAATPDPSARLPFPGMAVAYKSNSAHFWTADVPGGTVPGIMPASFDSGSTTYQQLKP